MKMLSISMTVNGASVGPHEVPEGLSMNDYLREYLNLTGTKFGCGIGACSACVVILDNADGSSSTIHTCITPVDVFVGKSVRTIEGIARGGELTAVQTAFLDHFAFQCGYCTPGFVNRRRCWSRVSPACQCRRPRWRRAFSPPWTAISVAAPAMCTTTRPCAR